MTVSKKTKTNKSATKTTLLDPLVHSIQKVESVLSDTKLTTLKPLLPLVLSLRGQPYTIDRYFAFEPFFRARMPRRTVLMSGRQVSKSTSLAARGIIQSLSIPYFSTLYITPLFEMTRRFSQNYIRPFIEESPVRGLMQNADNTGSVLQRTFRNRSKMIFSFAFMNADRTRGISTDKMVIDEVQDIDKTFLPIIRETMSGSSWGGLEEYAGTPKSLENCLEGLWQESSQAEWCIPCDHCRHWNTPAMDHDLVKMIGPWREDIGYDKPGTICAKCHRPIRPHVGRWIHAFPERRWKAAGYHIPQLIMPMHYGDPEKWSVLLAKQQGKGNTPINVFFNEVCGVSYDTGSRLITLTELKAAATLPWHNKIDEALPHLNEYMYRVLAIDWGGGGENEVSFTVLAVLGMRATGQIDVIWGLRSLTPHDHVREAELCIAALQKFKCHTLAHDYTGAGSLRETLISQAGYPIERIINIAYIRAAASARIMTFKPPTRLNPRSYYQVDKARSLLLTCNQIKSGWLNFFKWDYEDNENTGLIYDFLALVDEKVDSRIGKDIYTIIRDPKMRDDFAQAVNIGCCTLWHMSDRWPNVAAVAALRLSSELASAIEPVDNLTQLRGL